MTRNVILSSCLRGLCCRKSIEISGMPVTSCINSKWISIPSHSLSGEMRLWTISGPIILFLLLWVFPLTPGFGQDINLSKSEVRELFHRLLIDTLNVQTGDMVLFKSKHLASRLTQFGTFSPFSHCGMVIRDEMDNLWITHATDNVYEDYQIPVKEEQAPRGGVILTRLEDSFFQNGYYRKIFFYKFDDIHFPRPTKEKVLQIYEKYKNYPFEESPLRFTFASLDLALFDYDLLSLPEHEQIFCSEYQVHMLSELGLLTDLMEAPNEYTPKDISNLVFYQHFTPTVFRYRRSSLLHVVKQLGR